MSFNNNFINYLTDKKMCDLIIQRKNSTGHALKSLVSYKEKSGDFKTASVKMKGLFLHQILNFNLIRFVLFYSLA